jgi:uncharacterized protein YkwD
MSWASNPTTEMPPAPEGRFRRSHLLVLAAGLILVLAVVAAMLAPAWLGGPTPAESVAGPGTLDLPSTVPATFTSDGGVPASAVSPTVTPPPPAATLEEAMEDLILTRTNAERVKARCAALRLDTKVRTAARRQALDMATVGFHSHTGSDGSEPPQRMKAAGYAIDGGWAENVARAYPDVDAVMAGWMQSPSHRAEILRCTWRSTGIGVARAASGELFYVQDFGGR